MPPRVPTAEENEIIAAELSLLGICPDSRVLDVGCGAGVLIQHLARRTAPHNITAVDISPNMIASARERFDGVNFMECDFMTRDFGRMSFDFVLCYNAFPHLDDKKSALFRMADMTAADGKIAVMHSMGRDALNKMHAKKGAPVAGDILPEIAYLHTLSLHHGLTPIISVDTARMFMFAAQKTRN